VFVTLLLLFINIGPLNAAMANVLPAELRSRGFAVTTTVMHLLGDAISPWLIGLASDRIGLTIPVLVTGCLLAGRSSASVPGGAGRETPSQTRGGERRVPTMAVYVAYALFSRRR